jgi:cytochrome c oxidase assembly factor CtaG
MSGHMTLMMRYSAIAATLILAGSVTTASAAEPRVHRNPGVDAPAARFVSAPVTRIDPDGNYVIDHSPSAVPMSIRWTR